MSSEDSKLRIVYAAVTWIVILVLCVVSYKYWWAPKKEKEVAEQVVAEKKETLEKTSAVSRYQHVIKFSADSFSGYAPLRSEFFKNECAKYTIRMDITDEPNYKNRLKDLADGKIDMAVFTIDALIKCSAEYGDLPATIVSVIDESVGADSIIGAGKTFPNIDSINDPEVKIVCIADSPSETMARVVMAHFNLDKINESSFEFKNSAEEVYEAYKNSKPTDKKLFSIWEPYASKMLDNPDYHSLINSSKFRGYVVDVIVARRDFLLKNEPLVEQVVKSYLSTVFNNRTKMTEMIVDDAVLVGDPLKEDQAKKLVSTVWWKNTQETFGHFGFITNGNLQHIEEICRNITSVLVKTGAIPADPTNGKPNLWYYDGIIKKLFDSSWHPGFGSEDIRQQQNLAALSEEEWTSLKSVGTLSVPRLVFARGTAKLTEASETTLQELSEQLKSFPQYYLTVQGNAASDGNLEANLKLATDRANVSSQWLIDHGVDKNRIRAESAKPNGSTTVLFILSEQPY
jgi:flagellar motor protein MotB